MRRLIAILAIAFMAALLALMPVGTPDAQAQCATEQTITVPNLPAASQEVAADEEVLAAPAQKKVRTAILRTTQTDLHTAVVPEVAGTAEVQVSGVIVTPNIRVVTPVRPRPVVVLPPPRIVCRGGVCTVVRTVRPVARTVVRVRRPGSVTVIRRLE